MGKLEELALTQIIDNQERVIKEQKEDIERLQSELDKQIKDNRKLVKALKVYASIPKTAIFGAGNNLCVLAQEILKEVGEEE